MTPRERFMKQMRFERVDRPVRCETLGFWGETVARFREEGMPEDADPWDYFGMERWEYIKANVGFTNVPYEPSFERQELERTERTVTFRTEHGIVMRQRVDKAELSMPQWLRFPVETRADFEKLRDERLDPETPSRYPDWEWAREKYKDQQLPLGIPVCGAYGTPRNFFGEERLAYVYYDDPDLIHEIMRWWLHFYKRALSIITDNVEGLDFVLFWEDMAHKTGPLISPEFVRVFMMPYYEELIDHIRSCGIDLIWVDTDGNAEVLLDLFVNAGVNMMCPFEIAAGFEPLPVREKYGDRLAIFGGIDKRAVAEGGEVMKKEVLRKVPALLESGGYIPCIDHATPPDTSFQRHREFVDFVRELGEKYGG